MRLSGRREATVIFRRGEKSLDKSFCGVHRRRNNLGNTMEEEVDRFGYGLAVSQ